MDGVLEVGRRVPIYRVKVSGDLHPDSAKALGEKVKGTIRAKMEHPLWQGAAG